VSCHHNDCRQDLSDATAQMSELFKRVKDIQQKAADSEVLVQEICRDIRKVGHSTRRHSMSSHGSQIASPTDACKRAVCSALCSHPRLPAPTASLTQRTPAPQHMHSTQTIITYTRTLLHAGYALQQKVYRPSTLPRLV
jgi:hypothetical protein